MSEEHREDAKPEGEKERKSENALEEARRAFSAHVRREKEHGRVIRGERSWMEAVSAGMSVVAQTATNAAEVTARAMLGGSGSLEALEVVRYTLLPQIGADAGEASASSLLLAWFLLANHNSAVAGEAGLHAPGRGLGVHPFVAREEVEGELLGLMRICLASYGWAGRLFFTATSAESTTALSAARGLLSAPRDRLPEDVRDDWDGAEDGEMGVVEQGMVEGMRSWGESIRNVIGAVSAAPRGDKHAFARMLRMAPECVLFEGGGGFGCPKHWLVADPAKKRLVLCIRGTMSVADALTDLLASETPFAGGRSHEGMVAAAQNIFSAISLGTPKIPGMRLQTLLAETFPGYGLALTGHSLGGGVATLVTVLLLRIRISQTLAALQRLRETEWPSDDEEEEDDEKESELTFEMGVTVKEAHAFEGDAAAAAKDKELRTRSKSYRRALFHSLQSIPFVNVDVRCIVFGAPPTIAPIEPGDTLDPASSSSKPSPPSSPTPPTSPSITPSPGPEEGPLDTILPAMARSRITSVVHGDDIIPRLCMGSARDLVQLLARLVQSNPDLASKAVGAAVGARDVDHALAAAAEHIGDGDRPQLLFHPGRILLMRTPPRHLRYSHAHVLRWKDTSVRTLEAKEKCDLPHPTSSTSTTPPSSSSTTLPTTPTSSTPHAPSPSSPKGFLTVESARRVGKKELAQLGQKESLEAAAAALRRERQVEEEKTAMVRASREEAEKIGGSGEGDGGGEVGEEDGEEGGEWEVVDDAEVEDRRGVKQRAKEKAEDIVESIGEIGEKTAAAAWSFLSSMTSTMTTDGEEEGEEEGEEVGRRKSDGSEGGEGEEGSEGEEKGCGGGGSVRTLLRYGNNDDLRHLVITKHTTGDHMPDDYLVALHRIAQAYPRND